MQKVKEKAFVAYSSRDKQVAEEVAAAVLKANSAPIPVWYEPWEFNDVPGVALVSPILAGIEESAFIVADITYLNLNVVFEVGYAIGCDRRVFLIRHGRVIGDKELAREAGIFDTLGYYEYQTSEDLRQRLMSTIEVPATRAQWPLDHKAPIYIVEPAVRNDANILLTSRVKKAGYRYRSFNPVEDVRLSSSDALRQVATASGVVMMLQEDLSDTARAHNVRAMFVAGLASGMGKPTLIIAPVGYDAPLDVRDAVKYFRYPADIIELVMSFTPAVNSYSQQVEPPPISTDNVLEILAIGDPTAENEMTTLSQYYLRTNEYQRALRGEVNLVVGRKGSGKTALFIQVRDRIRSDKRNIMVDLKPEGYQLLKLKEAILAYLSEGSRQHLITGFWEYLILLEVAYKLLEKDKNTYKFNHEINELYLELEQTYRTDSFSVEGDFSERLSSLSQRLADEYEARHPDALHSMSAGAMSAEEVSRVLYAHDIRHLKERISAYLEKKQSVWILFDNLDKGWSTNGVDVLDATVLRCLIDAGRKIEREMARAGHSFHCIVFVRNDVYEHLMQNSADYGKEMRATLDWTDADLLKEMLRLRLVSSLEKGASNMTFEALWRMVCTPQIEGEDSSNYIISRSLMRPRNVLKIFNHARGFAVNFGHTRIEEEDFEKGLKAYSQDLIIELDRELADVSHGARDLLYHFIDVSNVLGASEVRSILESAGVESGDMSAVLDYLLYYGVLGIRAGQIENYIFDTHYDLRPLKIRAERAGEAARYVINPAFWPALGIRGATSV